MSILLVGLDREVALATTRRLVDQGDQVRVLANEGGADYETAGAHVARGDPTDDDLVERAAQGVRTLVVGALPPATLGSVLEGVRRAGVGRVVHCVQVGDDLPELSAASTIVLRVPRRRRVGRGLEPVRVAEAIDAADDLAGDPSLVADLSTTAGWAALRLKPPG